MIMNLLNAIFRRHGDGSLSHPPHLVLFQTAGADIFGYDVVLRLVTVIAADLLNALVREALLCHDGVKVLFQVVIVAFVVHDIPPPGFIIQKMNVLLQSYIFCCEVFNLYIHDVAGVKYCFIGIVLFLSFLYRIKIRF